MHTYPINAVGPTIFTNRSVFLSWAATCLFIYTGGSNKAVREKDTATDPTKAVREKDTATDPEITHL